MQMGTDTQTLVKAMTCDVGKCASRFEPPGELERLAADAHKTPKELLSELAEKAGWHVRHHLATRIVSEEYPSPTGGRFLDICPGCWEKNRERLEKWSFDACFERAQKARETTEAEGDVKKS